MYKCLILLFSVSLFPFSPPQLSVGTFCSVISSFHFQCWTWCPRSCPKFAVFLRHICPWIIFQSSVLDTCRALWRGCVQSRCKGDGLCLLRHILAVAALEAGSGGCVWAGCDTCALMCWSCDGTRFGGCSSAVTANMLSGSPLCRRHVVFENIWALILPLTDIVGTVCMTSD